MCTCAENERNERNGNEHEETCLYRVMVMLVCRARVCARDTFEGGECFV